VSYAVLCDGCKAVLAETSYGRPNANEASLDVPDNTWVVFPPGTRDLLRRHEHTAHACDKKCLTAWLRRKGAPKDAS
jgi:hypothetical protein